MKKKLKTILNFVSQYILEKLIISKRELMKIILQNKHKIKYNFFNKPLLKSDIKVD